MNHSIYGPLVQFCQNHTKNQILAVYGHDITTNSEVSDLFKQIEVITGKDTILSILTAKSTALRTILMFAFVVGFKFSKFDKTVSPEIFKNKQLSLINHQFPNFLSNLQGCLSTEPPESSLRFIMGNLFPRSPIAKGQNKAMTAVEYRVEALKGFLRVVEDSRQVRDERILAKTKREKRVAKRVASAKAKGVADEADGVEAKQVAETGGAETVVAVAVEAEVDEVTHVLLCCGRYWLRSGMAGIANGGTMTATTLVLPQSQANSLTDQVMVGNFVFKDGSKSTTFVVFTSHGGSNSLSHTSGDAQKESVMLLKALEGKAEEDMLTVVFDERSLREELAVLQPAQAEDDDDDDGTGESDEEDLG